MIAGLLAKAYGEQPQGYSIRADVDAEMDRSKRRPPVTRDNARGGERSRSDRPERSDMTGGVLLTLTEGRSSGWEVGSLLGAICRSMGIKREDVGNIKLRDTSASVEVSAKAAELLQSRKSRMTKEGIELSSVRALTAQQHAEAAGRARQDMRRRETRWDDATGGRRDDQRRRPPRRRS